MGSLKHINISSDDMVVFEKVKSDQKLKTDAAVLKYLLNMYMENMDDSVGRLGHPKKTRSSYWTQLIPFL